MYLAGGAVLLLAGLLRSPKVVIACALGFVATLLPVACFPRMLQVTQNGRFLYLPALWAAVLACNGTDALLGWRRGGRASLVAAPLCALALLPLCAASLRYQTEIWAEATRLARSCVEQFERWKDSNSNLQITNLPFKFVEGPYILKAYAFGEYYGRSPRIRANGLYFRRVDARLVGQWIEATSSGEFVPSAPVETITFDLAPH
jgi:hypothetical protein